MQYKFWRQKNKNIDFLSRKYFTQNQILTYSEMAEFEKKVSDFAQNCSKNVLCLLKQNQMI